MSDGEFDRAERRLLDRAERQRVRRMPGAAPGRPTASRWGQFEIPEDEVGALPDVDRQGRRRARLRHRLHLGVAGPAGRPHGRRPRPDAGPAGDGSRPRRRDRPGPAARAGRGRGGAAARRALRPRRLRVRRRHLGRPVPVDPRGRPAAAPGRRARVPRQLAPVHPVRPRRRGARPGDRPRPRPARPPPGGVHRRPRRGVPPPPRRDAPAAARERLRRARPHRAVRARGHGRPAATSPRRGRRRWPVEEIWRARKR